MSTIQPKKIEPGSELHFALLGTPMGWNFLTGKDYADMQAFAKSVWDAATERAAKQEREKADALLKALKDLSKMYAHTWDLVDGGLTMMGESVPLFERCHKAASEAIEHYEAAAIRAKGGEANG